LTRRGRGERERGKITRGRLLLDVVVIKDPGYDMTCKPADKKVKPYKGGRRGGIR